MLGITFLMMLSFTNAGSLCDWWCPVFSNSRDWVCQNICTSVQDYVDQLDRLEETNEKLEDLLVNMEMDFNTALHEERKNYSLVPSYLEECSLKLADCKIRSREAQGEYMNEKSHTAKEHKREKHSMIVGLTAAFCIYGYTQQNIHVTQ